MKIYLLKQGETGQFCEVENELEAMQKLVGGFIEVIRLQSDLLLICNEEADLKKLKPNRFITHGVIKGDFFICGVDGEDFADLPSKYNDVLSGIFGAPNFDKKGRPII